jgi:hypothetical protein
LLAPNERSAIIRVISVFFEKRKKYLTRWPAPHPAPVFVSQHVALAVLVMLHA